VEILPAEAEQIRELAAADGLEFQDPSALSGDVQEIRVHGHLLPAAFVWFCSHYASHDGWPRLPCWPGLFSPFGSPSPLERENSSRREGYAWEQDDPLRREEEAWPENLVSFFGTDDGVYCFCYDGPASPRIVYVDDWGPPSSDGIHTVDATFDSDNWLQWFSKMALWVKGQRPLWA
jgi:hypothetical protein